MPTLQDLYNSAYADYANDSNSAIARTRSRGLLEQLSPLVQQSMQNEGGLAKEELRGQFGLTEREMANVNNIATQQLANKGKLADRKLANIGNMDTQRLANTGRIDKQRLSDKNQLERLGITTGADLYKAHLNSSTNLTERQMINDSTASEGVLNRAANRSMPRYEKINDGVDKFGNKKYKYINVATVPEINKGVSAGSISPEQLDGFRLTTIKPNIDNQSSVNESDLGPLLKDDPRIKKKSLGQRYINSRLGHLTGHNAIYKGVTGVGRGYKKIGEAVYNKGIKPAYNYLAEEVK